MSVFKCMPKGYKNQIVTAGRLLAVLDMRPSTTIKTTNNEASLLTAPPNLTVVPGPYLFPNYQDEDRKQAQTLNGFRKQAQTPKGSFHIHSP